MRSPGVRSACLGVSVADQRLRLSQGNEASVRADFRGGRSKVLVSGPAQLLPRRGGARSVAALLAHQPATQPRTDGRNRGRASGGLDYRATSGARAADRGSNRGIARRDVAEHERKAIGSRNSRPARLATASWFSESVTCGMVDSDRLFQRFGCVRHRRYIFARPNLNRDCPIVIATRDRDSFRTYLGAPRRSSPRSSPKSRPRPMRAVGPTRGRNCRMGAPKRSGLSRRPVPVELRPLENSGGATPPPRRTAPSARSRSGGSPGAPEASAEPARDPGGRDDGIGAADDRHPDDPARVAQSRSSSASARCRETCLDGPPVRLRLRGFRDGLPEMLEADRGEPRKQRHTAHRIFERPRDEHWFTGGQAAAPAALIFRPQPDQTGLHQDQALEGRRTETHRPGHLAPARSPHRHRPSGRMPGRRPKPRTWFRPKRIRSPRTSGSLGHARTAAIRAPPVTAPPERPVSCAASRR